MLKSKSYKNYGQRYLVWSTGLSQGQNGVKLGENTYTQTCGGNTYTQTCGGNTYTQTCGGNTYTQTCRA